MRRVKFKKYAGIRINGDVPMDEPGGQHIERASWLTAMVESGGKFGTVISYDGTGMTAGLHQAIAVYPRELAHPDGNALNDQGPLWKLLHRCFQATQGTQATYDMIQALENREWVVVNGVLRHLETGKVIDGKTIRHELSGAKNGCMPSRGSDRLRAEYWAGMFHTYFSELETFGIQEAWGQEKLIKRVERIKLRHAKSPRWKGKTIQDAFYGSQHVGVVRSDEMFQPFDLAMCVWMSYTVNAPAVAMKKIAKCIPDFREGGYEKFSRSLIRSLGKSKWGRWAADVKNGRYQRTRKYAMEVWPRDLFVGPDAVMPNVL